MKYIKEFYNLKYGKCYLLSEKEKKHLVYSDKCFNHYIVCTYIDNMETMMGQEFFEKLEDAKNYYEKGD